MAKELGATDPIYIEIIAKSRRFLKPPLFEKPIIDHLGLYEVLTEEEKEYILTSKRRSNFIARVKKDIVNLMMDDAILG